MGAGDHAESHLALGHAVVLSLAWGAVVGLVMWVGASPLADLCRLGSDAADMLEVYVRIIASARPAAARVLVGALCLSGAGESVLPLSKCVAAVEATWPPAEKPRIPIRFGSIFHAAAFARVRRMARWASSKGT